MRIFILLTFLFSIGSMFAQTREMEEIWKKELDSCKVNYRKADYFKSSKDKILELFDKQPNFGMYKDNYFSTGIPTNKTINKQTADAKFQISIRQRLLKKYMPFNTQLMLIYSQKSFWDIYNESSPFADNNYNPGLVIVKPIIQDDKLLGMASLSLEHESNGKSGIDSRSCNFVSISGVYFYNICLSVQVKLWYGWVRNDNPDLFKYRGYGLIAFNYRSFNDRFGGSIVLTPCAAALNTQLEASFRLTKKSNQYLFVQWYIGYGESMLEYNQYSSMVRAGICLKPPLRDYY